MVCHSVSLAVLCFEHLVFFIADDMWYSLVIAVESVSARRLAYKRRLYAFAPALRSLVVA